MAQWINHSHFIKNKMDFSKAAISLRAVEDIFLICGRKFSHKKYIPLTKMQVKRYCDILGVPINASIPKIKQAFYKKSFLVHPDRNSHAESAGRRFNEISEAYKSLIAHKKQGVGEEHHVSDWQKDHKSPNVRPWFKSQTRTKFHSPPKHSPSDENQFHGTDISSANPNQTLHSSASSWCGEFYKQQLQEDYERNQKIREERLRNKLKKNSNSQDNCSIM